MQLAEKRPPRGVYLYFSQFLVDLQPHTGHNATMYPRHAREAVREALSDSPVTLIHGARQVGKTTLARDLLDVADARYLTLDSVAALSAARSDPEGFISGFDGPVVIDEVQRAPALFPAIKKSIDIDRTPGRFLLTGSANVLTLPRLSESLAGRMEIIRLWPLSQGEIDGSSPSGFVDALFAPKFKLPAVSAIDRSALFKRIERGGFPEVVGRKSPERRNAWFESYLTAILQRDVRDLSNIEDLAALPRLLRLLATRIGGLLNYADLARSLELPQSTLKRYFALLESIFLVVLVEPWSSNLGARLVKSPKIHLVDTGLTCHLLGLDELSMDHPSRGGMVESFAVMELLKQTAWSRSRPRLYHFRTSSGQETDLLLEDRKGRLVGIEVKDSASANADDFRGLRAMHELVGDRFVRGVVLHTGTESIAFGDALFALPISSIWAT